MAVTQVNKRPPAIPWFIPVIIAAGILLRIFHLFSIPLNTPFHLGGLYYEFSRQILLNGFNLPGNIPYYSPGGIPFVYPPLPFYLQAIVLKLFNPPLFVTVDLLPPLLTVFSVPLFYWMIRQVTDDRRFQVAALVVYALMPSAFVNQIEGAGLAEACGTLALLGYLGLLFKFEKDHRLTLALGAGACLGLCILSSPGSAYGAVLLSLIFFVLSLVQGRRDKNPRGPLLLLLTGLTGVIVSSPYWLGILLHHDLGTFVSAFFSQHGNGAIAEQLRYLVTFKSADMILFTSDEGAYGFLLDWLIFAGLIWAVLNKKVSYVVMFFTLWLVPRLGSWLVAFPATLLGGLGICQVAWPLFQKAFPDFRSKERPPLAPGVLLMVLAMLLLASPVLAVHDMVQRADMIVTAAQVNALQQEQALLPADAQVLIVGDGALREWSPTLLQREVLNCEFGLEWKPTVLEQVNLINEALDANDLARANAIIHTSTGLTSYWLVGTLDAMEKLLANANGSYTLTLQDRTPQLVTALVQIK